MIRGALMCVVLLAVMLMATGCTHNQLDVAPDGRISQATSTANVSRLNGEGEQQAAYHGLAPTLLKQDIEGNWVNMPGPVGILSYVPSTGQVYVISPKDAVMTGVKFTPQPAPGQPAFEAATISMNLSEPLKQHVAAYVTAMQSLVGMTQVEATARIEQMKAAGEITADVANLLLTLFVPTLK
jgi:hypothetical protein